KKNVRGHSDRQSPVGVVDTESHFKCFHVALGPADVALCCESGVGSPVEGDAFADLTRGKSNLELVTDTNPVDVSLFDIGANPEVIRIDQRHDGLSKIHDLTHARSTDVHKPGNRSADLRIAK